MKRTAIAAAWIIGTTVPVLAAVVFVFGCCVLPFHAYIHKAMPMCERAIDVMRGEHAGHRDGVPAREKQEPAKRAATVIPRSFPLAAVPDALRAASPVDAAAYRSYIALGALRCDQDVGLHLLAGTLLI